MGMEFDPLAYLGSAVNKVLDAAHVEKLKSAYRMQQMNLEQAIESNGILSENRTLLRQRNEELEEKVTSLEAEAARLKELVPAESIYEPTRLALRVLQIFRAEDQLRLEDIEVANRLDEYILEVQVAFYELRTAGLVEVSWLDDGCTTYHLTIEGKKFVVERWQTPDLARDTQRGG